MDKIRNSKNYLADKTKSKGSQVSKETNNVRTSPSSHPQRCTPHQLTTRTEIAKDPHVGMTTRARAAGNAMLDKMDQSSHSASAQVHKQAAKH
jgi:hypothetical protein